MFVKNYGRIPTPLTSLLKKHAFYWTPEAANTFDHLKQPMYKAPILATPDFTNFFIVECDASGNRVGAVLMEEDLFLLKVVQ